MSLLTDLAILLAVIAFFCSSIKGIAIMVRTKVFHDKNNDDALLHGLLKSLDGSLAN